MLLVESTKNWFISNTSLLLFVRISKNLFVLTFVHVGREEGGVMLSTSNLPPPLWVYPLHVQHPTATAGHEKGEAIADMHRVTKCLRKFGVRHISIDTGGRPLRCRSSEECRDAPLTPPLFTDMSTPRAPPFFPRLFLPHALLCLLVQGLASGLATGGMVTTVETAGSRGS